LGRYGIYFRLIPVFIMWIVKSSLECFFLLFQNELKRKWNKFVTVSHVEFVLEFHPIESN